METPLSEPKPALPLSFAFFPIITVVLVAAIRPNACVRAATALGYVTVAIGAHNYTIGANTLADYSVGSWFGANCFSVWWLLFYLDPVKDIRHKNDKVPVAEMPLLKRAYWIASLWYSPRAIGWNVEIDKIPPLPPPSRVHFFIRSLYQVVFHLLLVDAAQTYKRLNPLFQLSGDDAVSLGAQGYPLRCLNVLAFMAISYTMLNIQYYVLAIVGVASGFWEPAQWPDAFGRWAESYTVRRFWGRTWHQMMRRVAASTGKVATHSLGCTQGSWTSARVQLLVGFSASGLVHVFGDAAVARRFIGCSFPFFFVQPFAITLEDAVTTFAKKRGVRESRWTRLVGYVWTFAWFSWTTPWFVDWTLATGTGQAELVPFTVVGKVVPYIPAISAWTSSLRV